MHLPHQPLPQQMQYQLQQQLPPPQLQRPQQQPRYANQPASYAGILTNNNQPIQTQTLTENTEWTTVTNKRKKESP